MKSDYDKEIFNGDSTYYVMEMARCLILSMKN
jgi:hypothetical protein